MRMRRPIGFAYLQDAVTEIGATALIIGRTMRQDSLRRLMTSAAGMEHETKDIVKILENVNY